MNSKGNLLPNDEKSVLAIDGGAPLLDHRLSSWPRFEEDEIKAVQDVLTSGKPNYWGGGQVRQFEDAFAARCDTKYGIALANGTLALELALIVLGIGPGDEVIVTPRSFFASASSVMVRGATPVFADIDPASGNIDPASIPSCISPNTKAIIVVHLGGWPCDMDPICDLARDHGFAVIEDCAQAHGALYKGRPLGGLGDIGCFSFCQDKIITTGGEGGLFVTNDEQLWRKAWSYKDHGKSYDAVFREYSDADYRWLHDDFGTNWRMTEMQGAIGLRQLEKLDKWVTRRRKNAAILGACLAEYDAVRPPSPSLDVSHAYYKFYTYVDQSALKPGFDRDWIREALRAEGLEVLNGTCPEIYKEAAFDDRPESRPGQSLPQAQRLGSASLMFQVDHTLGDEEMKLCCQAIRKVMDVCAA